MVATASIPYRCHLDLKVMRLEVYRQVLSVQDFRNGIDSFGSLVVALNEAVLLGWLSGEDHNDEIFAQGPDDDDFDEKDLPLWSK